MFPYSWNISNTFISHVLNFLHERREGTNTTPLRHALTAPEILQLLHRKLFILFLNFIYSISGLQKEDGGRKERVLEGLGCVQSKSRVKGKVISKLFEILWLSLIPTEFHIFYSDASVVFANSKGSSKFHLLNYDIPL